MLIVLWGTLESNIDDNQDENEERVRDASTHIELDISWIKGIGIPNPNPLTVSVWELVADGRSLTCNTRGRTIARDRVHCIPPP